MQSYQASDSAGRLEGRARRIRRVATCSASRGLALFGQHLMLSGHTSHSSLPMQSNLLALLERTLVNSRPCVGGEGLTGGARVMLRALSNVGLPARSCRAHAWLSMTGYSERYIPLVDKPGERRCRPVCRVSRQPLRPHALSMMEVERELEEIEQKHWDWRRVRPLSERLKRGRPRSRNSRSKVVQRSLRVASSASHRSRKRECL